MKRKIISIALVLTFLLTTFAPVTAMAAEEEQILEEIIETEETKLNVSRISADSRYNTAIEVSKKMFPNGSKYAVIASGQVFPDGLVGGTLATRIEAPLLLTRKTTNSTELKTELKRLKVEEVFLLGGEATLSKSVEEDLKTLNIKVERLAGINRRDTAEKINFKIIELKGFNPPGDLYVGVDGRNFPDALTAAPFIGRLKCGYMHLHNGETNPDYIPYTITIGGISSVPVGIEKVRYAGANRYATAVEVAKGYKTEVEMGQDINIDTIVLVDGTNYPDALSSSPVASMNNGAILLTRPTNLPTETKEYIKGNKNIKNIIIVGGAGSVSTEVENELKELVR